jgi:hypothetical protein
MVIIGQLCSKILIQLFEKVSHAKILGKMKRAVMPLQYILVEEPFAKWGLDVIGPINQKYRKGH